MGVRGTESAQTKAMKQRRTVLVSTSGGPGGAESSLVLLARHLTRCDVHVVCPSPSWLARRVVECGARLAPLRTARGRPARSASGIVESLANGREIVRLCDKLRPDVVHANNLYAAFACALGGVHKRFPLIWHARDGVRSRVSAILCAKTAHAIPAVSRFVRRRLLAMGAESGKVVIVANGVDVPLAPNSPPKPGRKVFANVGPLVPWKNQHLFVAAAESAALRMPDAEFWIVGSDVLGRNAGYARQLAHRVADSPLAGRLRMLAWCDMAPLWAKIGCLVHTAACEPFGRVVIEAMAHGVPVIVAASGGPGEIVDDGVTGRRVDAQSPEGFASAMVELHRTPALCSRLAANGRALVDRKYLASQTAANVESVYDDVLGAEQDADRDYTLQPR